MLENVTAVLVDRRNYLQFFPYILENVRAAQVMGFDIETEDSRRHEGLNTFMKVDEEGFKSDAKPLVFDIPRTTICGFSIWPKNHPYIYYFNLAHADVENRLTFEEVAPIFQEFTGYYICHNAPFELTMTKACWGIDLTNVICSLQLCVSAYGPDEYSRDSFYRQPLDNFQILFSDAERLFKDYKPGADLSAAQGDLLGKMIAKDSKAAHSYNGWVKDMAYGYDLKKAVMSWFGYQMTTFKECLGERPHMGCLTGEEVHAYGCDDAYWCVMLYDRVLQYMMETNPAVIPTFFDQENPMIYIYSEITRNGIRVNKEEVQRHKHMERKEVPPVLRKLRGILVEMYRAGGYFDDWLTGDLKIEYMAKEKEWYGKSGNNTRQKILRWINRGDQPDDFAEIDGTNGATAKSCRLERGLPEKNALSINLTHYYVTRTLLYDLCNVKPIIGRGKTVESDGDAQNLLIEKHGVDSYVGRIIGCLKDLTSIEQRIKLYITPYELLIDPETSKIHSQVSSMLATRRMASSYPNFMQLPKSGGGAYVRNFFLPDKPNHVLLSNDWSQIELVRIAEESQDPDMLACYQKIPYDDLHTIAYMAVLEFTDELLAAVKKCAPDVTHLDFEIEPGEFKMVKFQDKNGAPLTPKAFIKYVRKEIGKVANFNYWFSGALASIGEMMGWSADEMWAATDRYRSRFPHAEDWRVGTQHEGCLRGYVDLFDHHRRVRFEATNEWFVGMQRKLDFMPEGVRKYFDLCMRNIVRRSKNQFINTIIQGGCAALAKRSIIKSRKDFAHWINQGYLSFKMSIHDELVWSVDRGLVSEFIPASKQIMCDHPDAFPSVLLNATTSIGLNFQAFDATACPYGQIELDEAPEVDWLPADLHGKALPPEQIQQVLKYLEGGMR
jgi:DNA polymerase I-like protein with 3'-5' exonuclease and polymerase domains